MADNADISAAEDILGLPGKYTLQDVNLAYRTRCKTMHPDARKGVSADIANAEMAQITSAYSLLRKQFRGDKKNSSVLRAGRQHPEAFRTTNATSARPRQANGGAPTSHMEFDPFGEYNDYVDVTEWTVNAGEQAHPSYSGTHWSSRSSSYDEYLDQVHEWNTRIRESQSRHQSHIDPHTIDRSRAAHSHDEPAYREPVLVSSCDGPGWWRDLAWFLPQDPSWYRDAMRLAHWLPWTVIVYVIALVAYPLPPLSEYGEMLLRGEFGSFVWWYSLFLMVYPFFGYLARHPIHDFAERLFAFPFRIACRIYMKGKRLIEGENI